MSETFKSGAARALFFATTAFAVSFAVWGLIAALAPRFTELYTLSATEKSLLIAIPVLLGSVGRIFAGMAADRFGRRVVFSALLVFSAIPAIAIGATRSSLFSVCFWASQERRFPSASASRRNGSPKKSKARRSASTAREISGSQLPSFSRPFLRCSSAIGARFSSSSPQ